jgi:hypothetical protein
VAGGEEHRIHLAAAKGLALLCRFQLYKFAEGITRPAFGLNKFFSSCAHTRAVVTHADAFAF